MRRLIWPAVALGLFVIGGVLMRGESPVQAPSDKPKVSFPRFDQRSYRRAQKRATLLQQVRKKEEGRPEEVVNVNRDPMMMAMRAGSTNLVIEANAIVNSPLGEILLGCMDAEAQGLLEKMKRELGIDPVQALDRVALGDQGQLLLSGHFQELDAKAFFGERYSANPAGDKGVLYSHKDRSDFVGIWDGQMIVAGKSEAQVREAIDRLEGRIETEPAMRRDVQYGEAYGRVDHRFVSKLLGDPQLEERLAEVVNNIELHVDTRDSVAMELRFLGDDADRLDELARSLGSLVALARVKAKAEGNEELEHLLEFAEVSGRGGSDFKLRLALSLDFIRETLGECAGR